MAGSGLVVSPELTRIDASGMVWQPAMKREERRAMRARSGVRIFQLTACVLCIGRKLAGLLASTANTFSSASLYHLSQTADSAGKQTLTG